jgi:predicted RNA-binding Zn-ribbon protein involved in translation (DUF1610 family)
LIHRSVRAEDLCDGGEDGPHGCPDANDVTCIACGHVYEVEDTNCIPACPNCGGKGGRVERCARCPLNDLDYARSHSAAGRLLNRLMDLEFDVGKFRVDWADVTAEEALGLRILADERDRRQREQSKKPKDQ